MITRNQILEIYEKASEKPDYGWMTYQPINVPGYEATFTQSGRKCRDRADAIMNHVRSRFPADTKFVDWGCNNGFFVFELAKHGYHADGVDRDPRYIEICEVAGRDFRGAVKPGFYVGELSPESIAGYRDRVAICLSVLHHVKHNIRLFSAFANTYRHAYVEMDGANYGYDWLRTFYWNLSGICEANDRYGHGTRKRRTWYCTNIADGFTYENIKMNNCLAGRGVFRKTGADGTSTVIKRENRSFAHTWIKTDISHELEVYRKYTAPFFPRLVSYSTEDGRMIELEFVGAHMEGGSTLDEIFDWLRAQGLYVIDARADQFIRSASGKYFMVDLESVFPAGEAEGRLKKPVKLKTCDEQLADLKRRLE